MGLFSLSFAGGSLLMIGAWESLISTTTTTASSSSPSLTPKSPNPIPNSDPNPQFSTVTLLATVALSLLFLLNSFLSFLDALRSHDSIGSSLQLQTLAASSLFLLFSLLGLSSNLSYRPSFPHPLLNLIALFGFVEEFLVFYLKIKDLNGVENRYYDLMLVPVGVCVVSTLVELGGGKGVARLARGIGLVLQGTWSAQMGFSFYSGFVAENCGLRERSRGNFTVVCKGHMDSHRGMAIAVLLFNCHLAFLVAVVVAVYWIVGRRFGGQGDYVRYRPLGGEMQSVDAQAQFTLDSGDGEQDGIREVRDEENMSRRENVVMTLDVNGRGSHN